MDQGTDREANHDERGGDPEPIASFMSFIPPKGRYWCHDCGCELELPGVCEPCGNKPETADYHTASLHVGDAQRSIPARFKDMRYGSELLARCVQADAIRAVRELRPWPVGIALVGEKDAGKTSLACAALHAIHQAAFPTRDKDGKTVKRPLETVKLIGSSVFVDYLDVGDIDHRCKAYNAKPEEFAAWDALEKAHRLVIDNVEPDRHDGPVGRLIQRRFRANRPTLITTWMDEVTAAQHFGAGVAKRMFHTTIEMVPVPKAKSAKVMP